MLTTTIAVTVWLFSPTLLILLGLWLSRRAPIQVGRADGSVFCAVETCPEEFHPADFVHAKTEPAA